MTTTPAAVAPAAVAPVAAAPVAAASGAPTPRLDKFFDLTCFEAIDSTNEELRRRADDGAPEGALVWAWMQGQGRGRRGRVWSSPPGNLYASLLLRPDCAPYTAAQLSFVAALAIHEAVSAALPAADHATLKWPNDVLIMGRKVAGILLESKTAAGGMADWVIVGTGINVLTAPDEAERPATSLRAEGSEVAVAKFLEDYAAAFLDYYRQWQDSGFAPIRAAWLERARGVGDIIEVRLAKETFSGIFEGLDENGALRVRTSAGLRNVTAGDVFLPPATEE